ncbi:polyprenyl synthetase family protein [Streptococcus didelphis]|uniref:polyprenyl synthetase family protein n=1 Tax=Streptococcus didelphis TaxID=102886 RepID=UPI00036624A4|nr:polyprenyl synthetase family protein [Streptococcus didelphis]
MSSYWSKFPEIQAQINQVCNFMGQKIQVPNPEIEKALIQLTSSGGKYLRPAFFFLFSRFGQAKVDEQKMVTIAASLEILHVATLVHDDVIDDSPLRRGHTSIQSAFGKDVAVYTGDYLFTLFFECLLETMENTPYLAINANSMKKILLGELGQMNLYFNQEQSVSDYLASISGKTAELFKLASKEGAYFAGADDAIVSLAGRIGYHIGMTFQILDDILDYTADPKTFNKPILEDLANGVYSLPLLLAMQEKPDAFKAILDKKNKVSSEDIQTISQLVDKHNGIKLAKEMANHYTQVAIDDIKQLPPIKAQKQLLQLTNHLLKRQI